MEKCLTNLLLYDLVLVKSDYVVRGTTPIAYFTHAVTFFFFSFADMIKVKRILIGITKFVLSRKIIFSNPDLRHDFNGKLFHTFVSTNLLLYELLLVKSDCVVTVTIQLRIPCVHMFIVVVTWLQCRIKLVGGLVQARSGGPVYTKIALNS